MLELLDELQERAPACDLHFYQWLSSIDDSAIPRLSKVFAVS